MNFTFPDFNTGVLYYSSLSYLTYLFLGLAICSLWIYNRFRLWLFIFVISWVLGLMAGVLELITLLPITLLGLACYGLQRPFTMATNFERASIRAVSSIVILFISISVGLRAIPGFNNLQILSDTLLSQKAVPYNYFLSFDKALIGLFVVGFYIQRSQSIAHWLLALKYVLPTTIVILLIVFPLALSVSYVSFDYKFHNVFFIWAISNLLGTCIAEEALFRGVIQKYLVVRFSINYSWGPWLGVVVAALIFGLAHIGGGLILVMLASIAGLGYGWIYLKTDRIEASILTHFFVNTIHFLFFTYPALATSS